MKTIGFKDENSPKKVHKSPRKLVPIKKKPPTIVGAVNDVIKLSTSLFFKSFHMLTSSVVDSKPIKALKKCGTMESRGIKLIENFKAVIKSQEDELLAIGM
jgi:hypothetical protein